MIFQKKNNILWEIYFSSMLNQITQYIILFLIFQIIFCSISIYYNFLFWTKYSLNDDIMWQKEKKKENYQ